MGPGRLGRLALPAGLATLATVYLVATFGLPLPPFGGPVTARAFPILVGAGLLVALVLMLLEQREAPNEAPAPTAPADTEAPSRLIPASVAIWTLLYIALLEPVGFIIATSVFLAALMLVFHRHRPVVAVASAIGFTAIIYLLFVHVLGVSLPAGLLARFRA